MVTVISNPGEWGAWTPWSDCQGVCGDGIRDRIRPCLPLFPELDDADCPNGLDEEVEPCYLQDCAPSESKFIYVLTIVPLLIVLNN